MTANRHLDFDLALEPAGSGYRATVVSPAGACDLDLDPAAGQPTAQAPARQSGEGLFRGIFAEPILERFSRSLELARAEGAGLRIRLVLDTAVELAALPWETLFDPELGEFLVKSEELLLVRYLPQSKPSPAFAAETPLRLLLVAPQPEDRPVPGTAAVLDSLDQALEEHVREGRLVVKRLEPATQAALQKELDEHPTHLLHFLGQGDFQNRARYGKLILEGRQGRSRAVSAELIGRLLNCHEPLRLAVLSSAGQVAAGEHGAADPFLGTAMDLVRAGLPAAVSLPMAWEEGISSAALRSLYGALAVGDPVDLSVAAAGRQLIVGAAGWGTPALFTSTAAGELFELAGVAEAPAQPVAEPSRPLRPAPRPEPPSPSPQPPEKSEAERVLEDKIARGAFDVFLSYKRSDGRAVKEIGTRLKESGVLPWLDVWELPPGSPWQRRLEEQIERIGSAAVFVGKDGLGPWQRREMDAILNEFLDRDRPVIPVLLPSAPARPKLPIFLKGLTWVDFRRSDPDPLERLIWGVTGSKSGLG